MVGGILGLKIKSKPSACGGTYEIFRKSYNFIR